MEFLLAQSTQSSLFSKPQEKKTIIPEITISYRPRVRAKDLPMLKNSRELYRILIDGWNMDTICLFEEFKVVLLNRAGRLKGIYTLSQGSSTAAVVDMKILIMLAAKELANGVVLVHNHPSESTRLSEADIALTEKAKYALGLCDIKLIDHLVITPTEYVSFADQGLLNAK